MQTAGNLVGTFAEFTTGVQIGEHELKRGHFVDRMLVHGDTAAVVRDGAGTVEVDGDLNAMGKTGQRFVDTVIHDFENAVVQTAFIRVADIHVRAFPHALETLEFLNFGGVVNFGASLIIR